MVLTIRADLSEATAGDDDFPWVVLTREPIFELPFSKN